MLERQFKILSTIMKFLKIGFIPFWIICAYLFGQLVGISEGQGVTFIVCWLIGGIVVFGYFFLKIYTELTALRNYITALNNKQFKEALTSGRIYYSVKRKGLTGADGSGLTVYDESAITNDIAAYSN